MLCFVENNFWYSEYNYSNGLRKKNSTHFLLSEVIDHVTTYCFPLHYTMYVFVFLWVVSLVSNFSVKHPNYLIIPPLPEGRGGILLYLCPSFRSSKLFFVTFFSVTVDGRNLIFGHKHHIGTPYCGQCYWTHQIPTSCLPTLLIFIHIEHICTFFVTFISATIDGRDLVFGH